MKMRKSPHEIVLSLANQLKVLDQGEKVSLMQLKESTLHHFMTLKSYVDLIEYIQTCMPYIRMEIDEKNEMVVRVNKTPVLELSLEDQALLYLLDRNAYGEKKAVETPKRFEPIVKLENEYVRQIGNKSYLTDSGLLESIRAAEEREDQLIVRLNKDVETGKQISLMDETAYVDEDEVAHDLPEYQCASEINGSIDAYQKNILFFEEDQSYEQY